VDWQGVRALASDLELQRATIANQVATIDAGEALDLMWRFLGLAQTVYERCDDSNGIVGGVFSDACQDLGSLAEAAKPESEALAGRIYAALNENDYGQYDGLIAILAPSLGEQGLRLLKGMFEALAQEPDEEPASEDREVIGWSSSGPIYADELTARRRRSTVGSALRDIADALGDVDGYIAQFDEQGRKAPGIAAGIARRLLDARRAHQALETLEAAAKEYPGRVFLEWEEAYIDVLDVLGRHDEAQSYRWKSFSQTLNDVRLKAYLKRLPDFDDVEAEERALTYALTYPNVHQALSFLVSWPALEHAAKLTLARAGEIDGDHYYLLSPAAEKLVGKYPLAATILRRAMIDFALEKARSKRYPHAAKHLQECESIVAQIKDFGTVETHFEYVTRLKARHGRKSGFWSQLR
jgi:Family of unknown function (DUF6880)